MVFNPTFSPSGFVQIASKTDPDIGPDPVFFITSISFTEINGTPLDSNCALYGSFPCF